MRPGRRSSARQWQGAVIALVLGWGTGMAGGWAWEPGLEGGISNEKSPTLALGDSELGTAGQFEDRLAVGRPWAGGAWYLALSHYSKPASSGPTMGWNCSRWAIAGGCEAPPG